MTFLCSPPSLDDLIRLLKAWRFWVLGAIVGAVTGAAVYTVAPPPYRARATVLVDFNLELALPEDTDRQHFYYLERETRKLEEIAFSDAVFETVAAGVRNLTSAELREDGKMMLSQPAEGGWHFYVIDEDPRRAASIATQWAYEFASAVQLQTLILTSDGLNPLISVTVTQAAQVPDARSLSMSTYLLIGAIGFLGVSAFVVLFFNKPK
jgi:hypothetical protein